MSSSQEPSLRKVEAPSKRFAEATTALSQTIVEVEQYLSALPGKRSVEVTTVKPGNGEGLRFARGRDGRWVILYLPPPAFNFFAEIGGKGHVAPARFADAPIDVKVRVAPLLSGLIDHLASRLTEDAQKVEKALEGVRASLDSLRKGGA